MKIRYTLFIGSLVLAAGLLLGAPFIWNYYSAAQQPLNQSYNVQNVQAVKIEEKYISGMPVKVSFPELNISRDVRPGYYDQSSQTWTLSKDAAHFATVTTMPNNKSGNTFIYGHNNQNVFSQLLNLRLGDTAIVSTDNGYSFTYTLASIRDADPRDVSPLQPHDAPILTVQTCAGAWYQDRRIFTFELTKAI